MHPAERVTGRSAPSRCFRRPHRGPVSVAASARARFARSDTSASASSTDGDAFVETSMFNGDLIFYRQRVSDNSICERFDGYESDLAIGLGDFKIYNSYNSIDPGQPVSIIPEIHVDIRLRNECAAYLHQCLLYSFLCDPDINVPNFVCPTSDPTLIPPLMVSMNIRVITTAAGVPTQTNLQGVMGTTPTGAPFRLGFFTDPAFAQDSFANVDVANFGLPLPSLPTNLSSIEVLVDTDHFQSFDGDIDNDGTICWTDRRIISSSIGSSIGSASYHSRADFDLDGDIDQQDFQAFLTVFDASACTADFDCSGAVDSQDFFDFQTAYMTNDPIADFNGDGQIASQDWFDFLAIYMSGC